LKPMIEMNCESQITARFCFQLTNQHLFITTRTPTDESKQQNTI
jgi:hypothetical protein